MSHPVDEQEPKLGTAMQQSPKSKLSNTDASHHGASANGTYIQVDSPKLEDVDPKKCAMFLLEYEAYVQKWGLPKFDWVGWGHPLTSVGDLSWGSSNLPKMKI